MAKNISTDIAEEINITARRGDTFELNLEIKDSTTGLSYNLSGGQLGYTAADQNAYSTLTVVESGLSVNYIPIYQAKMTIKKEGSEFDTLSVYTYIWQDLIYHNVLPSLTRAGKYRGDSVSALSSSQYAGIYLASSTGGEGEEIYIRIPHNYMNIAAGEYVYDFQVRKKMIFNSPLANSQQQDPQSGPTDSGASYTTWMKGSFTVTDDITKA